MALPIAGLDNITILNAYKVTFDELTVNGFKPKLIVIDNHATKYIKNLTKEICKLQLVKPDYKWVNAAEQAFKTFKDAFISTLATTDCNFPLQLWDKLTPQVITFLKMLHVSRIDPTMLAHEILHRP